MPYGIGSGGMAGAIAGRNRGGAGSSQGTSITKSVSYVATGTNSNQIIKIAGTSSDDDLVHDTPRSVTVSNIGRVPIVALLGYESYSDENTDAGTVYLHAFLLPGESITPPMRAVVPTANHLEVLDGEVVDFTAPNAALYIDSTADVDHATASDIGSDATHTTLNLENGHSNFFRVGDLIRLEDEICKVTAVGTGADLANSTLTIVRGLYGSTAATHADDIPVRLPFFNEHYDFDRALTGSSQLVQTDSFGKFKASNFFGYGRTNGASAPFGLVPGSIVLRFYSKAYQEIMMGGTTSNIPIGAGSSSKLSTSTAYAFNLVVDDSTALTVSFTTDSGTVNFGGVNGVLNKIQSAINTATQTVGGALYGYSCSVGVIGGKLRFTSNSHLYPHDGTNGSKILLADAGSGTNLFSGSAGIFPDDALMNAPVEPRLADLNVYDSTTYAKSFNFDSSRICYDDGKGNLIGCAKGTINYETGAINITGSPANASFEVSLIHNSPFSGKLDANKADSNTLTAVHANVLNKNVQGKISVRMSTR